LDKLQHLFQSSINKIHFRIPKRRRRESKADNKVFTRKKEGEGGNNSRGYPHNRAIPAHSRKMFPWKASVELFSWKIIGYCHCQSEEEKRATSTGLRGRNTLNQGTGRLGRKGE
jgi:hypothetical protein